MGLSSLWALLFLRSFFRTKRKLIPNTESESLNFQSSGTILSSIPIIEFVMLGPNQPNPTTHFAEGRVGSTGTALKTKNKSDQSSHSESKEFLLHIRV
ncbi:hypothetical protein DL98DRAFT_313937 [Cadophora sp. DSE1049]|nr:hypothetical protein DL98DRAFT_313937 [Cadophora sp. DSE1049]